MDELFFFFFKFISDKDKNKPIIYVDIKLLHRNGWNEEPGQLSATHLYAHTTCIISFTL